MLRIGHRGAPHVAPPNTLKGFVAAYEMGCDMVECDCRVSADGAIVLAHDPSVTSVDGLRCAVAKHTAEELARLDLGEGEGVPTLAELADWAAGRIGLLVDIKVEGHEAQVLDALGTVPSEGAIVCGAADKGRRRFRELAPERRISITVDAAHEAELVRRWDEIDTYAVTFQYPLVTGERVADLHRRGVLVLAWTVDDLCAMRLLAEIGVDGIITNRPDLFAEI